MTSFRRIRQIGRQKNVGCWWCGGMVVNLQWFWKRMGNGALSVNNQNTFKNIMDNIKTQELNAVMANAMQEEESRRQVFKMETSDGQRKRTLVLEEAPAVQNPMSRDVHSCVGCFFYQNPDYSCQDLGRFGLPSCVQFVKVVKKREVIFALRTK